MRSLSIVLALAMVMATSLVFVAPTSRAPALSRLFVTIEAGHADQNVFTPATIVLPSVPIILNVTVINNSTDINMLHTFSIRDNTGTKHIEITVPHPGDNASVAMAGLAAGALLFTVLGFFGVLFAWPQTNYFDPMATVTFWFGMVFLLLAVLLDVYRREFVPDELIHKKRRPKIVYKRDIR